MVAAITRRRASAASTCRIPDDRLVLATAVLALAILALMLCAGLA